MNAPPETLQVVRQWIEKADEDFVAARHLLGIDEQPPLSAVCFHAQQCVEKYFKALLTLQAITFPKTHDLNDLLARISQVTELDIDPVGIAYLNRYSVEGRYPGNWEPITPEDAKEAVDTLVAARTAIRATFPEGVLAAD